VEFTPSRRRGVILHLGAFLLNVALVSGLILQSLMQSQRGFFILFLLSGVVAFFPIPFILYRMLALARAKYTVDREGLSIQWGLRTEVMPIQEIEWIRRIEDIAFEIPLPPLRIPGAILGTQSHRDLGLIEFLASESDNMLLIAARNRIFAISPADPDGFLNAFQQSAEMGSIAPIQARTSRADFLVGTLLKDKLARAFIFLGIILSLGLLVFVTFLIPTRQTVPLGFNPLGEAMETSPSERLLLLPVLSLLSLVADISFGAYLYRRTGYRTAGYLVFASSLITPVSFISMIVIFILF